MKKLASLLPGSIRLSLLRRHLTRTVTGVATLTLADQPISGRTLQVSLRKDISGAVLGMDLKAAASDAFTYRMLYARVPVALRIFSQAGTAVRAVNADLSDGGGAPVGGLAFCSSREDVTLIPDPVFFNSGGYAEFRDPSLRLPWPQRHDIVLWRGTLTGIGAVTTESMRADDLKLRQRVRMCLILNSARGTDVKIRKGEGRLATADRERLVRHGLLGGKIKQSAWGQYKFALDVDGHTNAWSNFFVRLLLGCCVLKIGSEHGFRQWYYERLKPWQHYVPVRGDMADLIEKVDWCRNHDDECAKIAEAGRALADTMTVESEIADAVRRLEAAAA